MSIEDRLRFPAIGLIASGAANAICAALLLLSWLLELLSKEATYIYGSERARTWFYVGRGLAVVWNVAGLVLAAYIVSGGMEMMSGTGYRKARRAAILAMIPITSVCCVLGFPLGLWAFLTLNDPQVRAYMLDEPFEPPRSATGLY